MVKFYIPSLTDVSIILYLVKVQKLKCRQKNRSISKDGHRMSLRTKSIEELLDLEEELRLSLDEKDSSYK